MRQQALRAPSRLTPPPEAITHKEAKTAGLVVYLSMWRCHRDGTFLRVTHGKHCCACQAKQAAQQEATAEQRAELTRKRRSDGAKKAAQTRKRNAEREARETAKEEARKAKAKAVKEASKAVKAAKAAPVAVLPEVLRAQDSRPAGTVEAPPWDLEDGSPGLFSDEPMAVEAGDDDGLPW